MSMQADKQDVLKRIHSIEGHLGGIRKMIEEDSNCLDVLRQTYAVRKAIEKLEALLVEDHLTPCVHQAIANGDEAALLAVLAQFYPLVGNH
jgi:DNA-binding FrmR family transcriptional regulator